MSKYNITENKQQRPAAYRTTVSPEVMDELQRKVIQKIVVEKCYRDKNYSARQLAQDLGTNTRYISAVVNNRFHKNYTELVNGYRVEEAMSLMVDRRYQKEGYSNMVFTSNRDPAQWKENFCENDALLCALDRIFDDAVVFTIKGESFRGRKLETVALRTSTGSPADPQQAG